MKHQKWGMILAGIGAGAVNGLFGAGGGMVLIPLLGMLTSLEDRQMFSGSVAIILPMCIVSLIATGLTGTIAWKEALPYLPGSAIGGYLAFRYGGKIPVKWLHRGLGILIIWGGLRYLC
ncbi:MAG: sulfite exporter TauE/SafE family protein [Ruminococcaceae bacterium]|nr:sulfite exporter TauE/SafE family protein [Oscillospiraceae bacterium]